MFISMIQKITLTISTKFTVNFICTDTSTVGFFIGLNDYLMKKKANVMMFNVCLEEYMQIHFN
jgi:hypothetical protein